MPLRSSKVLAVIVTFTLAASVIAAPRARADAPVPIPRTVPTVPTVNPASYVFTYVKGTIRTNAVPLPGSPFTGWNCDDLLVNAISLAQGPPPAAGQAAVQQERPRSPGSLPNWGLGGSKPTWTKVVKPSGNWSSGQCTFSLTVPANSEFSIYVDINAKEFPCDFIPGLSVRPVGREDGEIFVHMRIPRGDTKTQDFLATGKPQCIRW